MGRIEKTVFISYRRTNFPWAKAIFQNLHERGYDVFLDYTGIASGDFERIILKNIRARAHFLVLLTPSALERCGDPADWLRREIEAALDGQRNIVPLMLEGFDFGTPAIAEQLTGKLAALKQYNAVSVPPEYFDAAMEKLRKFLNVSLDAVLQPASLEARRAATKQKEAAAMAPAVAKEELMAQQWFERGVSAFDPDQKLRFYSEVIRLKPDFADAFKNRGLVRGNKGDVEGAIEDYSVAIRLNPNDADAFAYRSAFRCVKGDLDGWLQDWTQVTRLEPDPAKFFNNQGVFCRDRGDLEHALQNFSEAIRRKPDFAEALKNRDAVLKAIADRSRA
jgi:tetratricopeptide (TPR) repeat protein